MPPEILSGLLFLFSKWSGVLFRDINQTMRQSSPPVCNYEGSNYQQTFWEEGGRAYEDAAEAIALKRLLPDGGRLMLELGAGAGRNTVRYKNYDRIALVDFSRTQLEQAREFLGDSSRYLYVAADVYHLPFTDHRFDGATMIRTLHHMAEPVLALSQVARVMEPGGIFILEFANKRNLKAILRYLINRQSWNPFTLEPVEFVALNFDFHPKAIRSYLKELNFSIERQLTVSHFRTEFLKKHVPTKILTMLDACLQWTGQWLQFSPSVFSRCRLDGSEEKVAEENLFQCPICNTGLPEANHDILCPGCGTIWQYRDGIYDFRIPELP